MLATWRPSDPVSEELQASLPAAIAEHEAALRPADSRAFAVALDRLFGYARAFGLPHDPDGRKAQVGIYREALGDLPPDLLREAMALTMRDWRWSAKMPLPGDIRRHAADALGERRAALRRLELARWAAALPVRRRSDKLIVVTAAT